jgi:hypothetical protein
MTAKTYSLNRPQVALHRCRRGPPHQEHALQTDQRAEAVPDDQQAPPDW